MGKLHNFEQVESLLPSNGIMQALFFFSTQKEYFIHKYHVLQSI